MFIYFAPMEGITGYVFRRAHHAIFRGIEKYYTPFVSPGPEIGIPKRSLRDILPENNEGVPVVPQILTARAVDFLKTAELCASFGYREVNLNLGCPSGTVVAKGKGSGMLSDPEGLSDFLEEVFAGLPRGLSLSVKTRIGRYAPEEFPALLEVFRQFPILELTVHPRIQKEFYKGEVHRDVFAAAYRRQYGSPSRDGSMSQDGSISQDGAYFVYNGDLICNADIRSIETEFPDIAAVMIGRGLLRDPFLGERWKAAEAAAETASGPAAETAAETAVTEAIVKTAGTAYTAIIKDGEAPEAERQERLHEFHNALVQGYLEAYPGQDNVTLAKMKELWDFLGDSFPDTARLQKKLKKARSLQEYIGAAEQILRER